MQPLTLHTKISTTGAALSVKELKKKCFNDYFNQSINSPMKSQQAQALSLILRMSPPADLSKDNLKKILMDLHSCIKPIPFLDDTNMLDFITLPDSDVSNFKEKLSSLANQPSTLERPHFLKLGNLHLTTDYVYEGLTVCANQKITGIYDLHLQEVKDKCCMTTEHMDPWASIKLRIQQCLDFINTCPPYLNNKFKSVLTKHFTDFFHIDKNGDVEATNYLTTSLFNCVGNLIPMRNKENQEKDDRNLIEWLLEHHSDFFAKIANKPCDFTEPTTEHIKKLFGHGFLLRLKETSIVQERFRGKYLGDVFNTVYSKDTDFGRDKIRLFLNYYSDLNCNNQSILDSINKAKEALELGQLNSCTLHKSVVNSVSSRDI